MARVTVEDCVDKIPNRFELVMLAAQRSRDLSSGTPLSIDRDNDRNPVVALREIAEETVEVDGLRDALVRGMQKHVELDEPEEDLLELMSADELLGAAGMLTEETGGEAADEANAKAEAADEAELEAVEEAAEEAPAAEAAAEGAPEDQAETPEAEEATEKE